MSDIIYADVTFPSGHSCTICASCCFMRMEKSPYDAVPLEIDWSSIADSRIEPTDLIKSVEYVGLTSSGCAVPLDCDNVAPIFGATHVKNAPGRLGRRVSTGPFTTARVWGGSQCSSYKLSMLVTYERCGHCFTQTFCVDVLMKDC